MILMKIKELMTQLQNFPEDAEVELDILDTRTDYQISESFEIDEIFESANGTVYIRSIAV